MRNKIEIRAKYKKQPLPLRSYPVHVDHPLIDVVLKNLTTNEVDTVTQNFIVDTGAAISILNKRYKDFLSGMTPVDFVRVRYGAGGEKQLPVYKVGMIIKGRELHLLAAYDEELPYLLLGFYKALDNLSYLLFDNLLKEVRMIKN
jgi:predicted aspartyl protease